MAVVKNSKFHRIKREAENDLEKFITLVHPGRVLGHVHKELIQWITRQDSKSHQLVLLPRDHQKSAVAAYYAAWMITRNPAIRILYISSTSNLATKQLKFIKDILTSDIYTYFWPEMVNTEESKREKWTEFEISVDHPLRKKENIRDPSIFTAGLVTGITGMHCDLAILDDVVVGDNSSKPEGRLKVSTQVSYLSSILGGDGEVLAVGTRYHPLDQYNTFLDTTYEEYNKKGEAVKTVELWEVFERQVEDRGDGTGQFLWPRMKRYDGKWFGFDANILSKKRAQYTNNADYRSQYYNNPNDMGTSEITEDMFQYYNNSLIDNSTNVVYYGSKRLNVFAAVDFAFSTKKEADFTCIAVVGIDSDNNYYVLELDRFKTSSISEYYDHILRLHQKWGFRTLLAEISAAQMVIVKDLKENYIRRYGLGLSIKDHRPTKNKEERIQAALQPKYQNGQIYHYNGGNCEILEQELMQERPAHDDCKDALAAVVEICVPPSSVRHSTGPQGRFSSYHNDRRPEYNSRFGGFA